MTNFLDDLIMLLSTDWFKPHWGVIGINLDELKKGLMQEGCRKIVGQILSGAPEKWLRDFSDERREETLAMCESLFKKSEAEEGVIETMLEWSGTPDEDLKAGLLFDGLTEDLLSDSVNLKGPVLSSNLRAIVAIARKEWHSPEIDFTELCTRSKSSWDRYIAQLTPELPTSLSDILLGFLTARRFKGFWTSIQDKLTPEQMEELNAWYRAAGRFRAKRDIAPSYFGGGSSHYVDVP